MVVACIPKIHVLYVNKTPKMIRNCVYLKLTTLRGRLSLN